MGALRIKLIPIALCAAVLAGCGLAGDPRAAGEAAPGEERTPVEPERVAVANEALPEAVEIETDGSETDPPGTEWFDPLFPEATEICQAGGAVAEAVIDVDASVQLLDIKAAATRMIAAVRWAADAAEAVNDGEVLNIEQDAAVWEGINQEIEAATTPAEMTLMFERNHNTLTRFIDPSPDIQAWWAERCTAAV